MVVDPGRGLGEAGVSGLLAAIRHRRSIGFKRMSGEGVSREEVEVLLEAANWGTSHKDTEPWRFVVFMGSGREVLAELFEADYRREHGADPHLDEALASVRGRVMRVPVWIAIGMEPGMREDGERMVPHWEEVAAVASAVQNLHLVAAAKGMAGMWHSKGSSVSGFVAEGLGWSAPMELLGFFQLGWPEGDWPEGERGDWSAKVRFVGG